MDIKELKELIDATIYTNGEKKIKASAHQTMLHEIVDSSFEKAGVIDAKIDDVDERLKDDINNKTESLTNELEATNTKLDSGLEKTKLDDLVLSQKIDNLASNIVGLGNNLKGEAKGGDVINLPSIALNSVAPSYRIEGLTATQLVVNGDFRDGTKSVELPVRIKSVGANLCSGRISHKDNRFIKPDGSIVGSNGWVVFDYCKVNSDTTYYSNMAVSGVTGIVFYDKDKKYISGINSSIKFTTVKGCRYIRFSTNINIVNLYVSKINQYTPYEESISYIYSNATLKSALQAKDYVENGTLFKNVFTTKEFKKDDVIRQYINESLVNTYAFYFDIEENKWLKEGFVNNNRVARFSDGETYSCVGSTIKTDVEDIVFFIEGGINYIVLKVNKTKIDGLTGATPLDKFKVYMGSRSLTIDYQANAEQVKLDTSGVVTTHENGTIFIENIKNVTDFYTANGLDVKDFKELVSIYKYEGSDLVQLDASKAVFATTLKHPDLQDGDLVFFEYKYLDSPLWGENTIEYFNQNNVLQSENGKVWRKVEVATNDGQLTTKLEEVK